MAAPAADPRAVAASLALAPLLLSSLLTGCPAPSAAPVNPSDPSPGAPSASSSASAAAAASSAAPAASAAARLGEGCWGLGLAPAADARLAQIGQRCAQGLKPLGEPRKLTLVGGEASMEVPNIPAGTCLRAAVAGEGATALTLLDAAGARLAADAGAGFAVVDAAGPVCPRKGEGLRLAARGGGGEVWVQVWGSKAP